MDFQPPQCGSARTVTGAPHRTVAPSHRRTATPAAIGAQTLLVRATRHNAHTSGPLKSMAFVAPQWSDARTRTAPSHRRTVAPRLEE